MIKGTPQNGFSIVSLSIVLAVLLAIGGISYIFVNRQAQTATNTSPATSHARDTPADLELEPKSETTTADAIPFVNVIQEDGSVQIVLPAAIAKTQDQIDILTDLHEQCKDSEKSNITISSGLFEEDARFKQSGSYARFGAQVCNPPTKKVQDLEGSGHDLLVRKTASGTWVIDSQGQMEAPGCALIDGKGYPVSLVPTCLLADGTQRHPK
ncbi:MAG TPA: hypothetical protein VK983_04965 [Candidatus Limnocylindrales bacterium]|nr:hypothetical protein [Candidatus Limnocylindrales bacterium]